MHITYWMIFVDNPRELCFLQGKTTRSDLENNSVTFEEEHGTSDYWN